MTDIEPKITPRLERIIWRGLGNKPIRRIAEETGLDPAVVLRLKNEMFDSVDELTILQKKQKLLVELEGIAHEAREAANNTVEDFKAGMWNSAIAAIKALMLELNRVDKADNTRVTELNRLRVNELMRLIDVTVAKTLNEIATTHNLDEDELLEIFQGHLRPAAQELDD